MDIISRKVKVHHQYHFLVDFQLNYHLIVSDFYINNKKVYGS